MIFSPILLSFEYEESKALQRSPICPRQDSCANCHWPHKSRERTSGHGEHEEVCRPLEVQLDYRACKVLSNDEQANRRAQRRDRSPRKANGGGDLVGSYLG